MKTYMVRFENHDEMVESDGIKSLKKWCEIEYPDEKYWMIAEIKYENYDVLDGYMEDING